MAIYTRFGSVVTVTGPAEGEHGQWVPCRREDGSTRTFLRSELKADGGPQEIDDAIAAATSSADLAALDIDLWEGTEADPLSANYRKPAPGGPRVPVPVKRMPR